MLRGKKTLLSSSWVLLAGALACGGDDAAAPADGGDDAPTADGADDACLASDEPLDLVGTWAARAWIDVYMVTPGGGIVHLCPDRYYGVSLITLRVRVHEQSGTTVRHTFNVCRLQMPRVEAAIDPACDSRVGMQLSVGPVLTALWPEIDYPGGAVLGGTTACSSYVAEELVAIFGADGTVGPRDPLPEWRSGCTVGAEGCVEGWEHVVDSDGDVHPGVTLTVDSDPEDLIEGEAYTAYRTVDLLRGTAWSSRLIRGEVEPSIDYQILDSDVLVGGAPLATHLVRENIPVFEIPETGSTFVLVRADGRHGAPDLDADRSGEVTCEEILAAESVFAPYQP
ncbi:MAG: hypothetical protein JXB32_22200 [Deltaproteobacteria bacterium]|nr:hypothetical protein [Deltaproteobacteria bacterium]